MDIFAISILGGLRFPRNPKAMVYILGVTVYTLEVTTVWNLVTPIRIDVSA